MAVLPPELTPRIESPEALKDFIDESELLRHLPMSRRTVFNQRLKGEIPFIRLAGRRIIYHWPSVQAALLRKQRGGDL